MTLTATVTSGAGTPTGNVTFWDGGVGTGTNLGTVRARRQRQWRHSRPARSPSAATPSPRPMLGDGSFAASTSDPLTQVIQDTTPPVFATCPASFTVEATSASGAIASWAVPTVTDNSGAAITPVGSHTPGATFPLGATVVTYTAQDPSGNAATPCAFTVTVQDTIAPVIVGGSVPAEHHDARHQCVRRRGDVRTADGDGCRDRSRHRDGVARPPAPPSRSARRR